MAGDFLKLNRHGTQFYFRRRVPDDLRAIVGQAYLIQSLRTGLRSVAIPTARLLAAKSDILFDQLRTMAEPDPKTFEVAALEWKLKRAEIEKQELLEEQFADLQAKHRQELAELRSKSREVVLKAHILGVRQGSGVDSNKGAVKTDKTIMEVFEELKDYKVAIGVQPDAKGGWSNPGKIHSEQTQHIKAFIDFIEGDCPIWEVQPDDVIAFNEFVMVTETINSIGSRKIRLNRAAAVFKFAKKKRYIKSSYTEEFKFDGKIKKNPFLKFALDDLKALFESGAYRNHRHDTSSQYWLPLLGLFTGARLNELCQLLRSDVIEKDGVPIISILDEEEGKRLKTEASRRLVPIHSKLIELGFLDFVRTISEGRIFPHLREDPDKPGDFGQKASEDFREYRRSVGVGNHAGHGKSRKVFHSFRSTFIDALRHAGVNEDRRRRLVGHEYDGSHNTNYNGGDILDMFPISMLKEDVERVRFDLDLTSYWPK